MSLTLIKICICMAEIVAINEKYFIKQELDKAGILKVRLLA